MPLDEILLKMRKKLKSDLFKLETNVNQLEILENQFRDLKKNHINNDDLLKNTINKQNKIIEYFLHTCLY